MASTTFEALRDEQIALVEALTPTSMATRKFEADEADHDFIAWCEANPTACFRRFAIEDLFDYEPVDVSDLNTEYVRGHEQIMVAYPEMSALYGADMDRDMRDIMREDMRTIKTSIGLIGYGNYTDGLTRQLSTDYLDLEAVTILVLTYRFEHYEAV